MKTAIVNCSEYDIAKVLPAIRKIAENTDFPDVSGKKVLIKPNILSDAKPEAGITTNPVVLEAVITLVKEKGAAVIYCGDSPGLQTPGFRGKVSGVAEVCERTGAIWCDFTDSPVTHKVTTTIKLPLAKILEEVDLTISVAKFKTHQLMYHTGCAKNLFGLVPGLNKSPCHLKAPSREQFARLLCGIIKQSKIAYGFLDGIISMEGPGPANGTLRYTGLLLGSADVFSADTAQAVIMGYDPEEMPLLAEARREGLTDLKPEYTLLKAEDLVIRDYRRIAVEKKTNLFSALILPFFTRGRDRRKAQERPAPEFLEAPCILCRRCVQICPAKALTVEEKKIVIDKSKCIRCYCCHEMCPKDAIAIQN